jgi:ABC-2 type transport system permease protein
VLSTGVGQADLFWGKASALTLVIGVTLLPAALVIVGVLWWLAGGDSQALTRLALLCLTYVVYFCVFGGLTLAASAYGRTSRASLVIMVGVWGFFCLVTPRAGSELAGVFEPLPSTAELARQSKLALEKGVDGQTEKEVAIEAIIKDLMAEKGMADTGLLVDDNILNGIELRAEAKWENQAFEHVMGNYEDKISAQEAAASWMGVVSPYVAMRSLSAGLSGTDYAHHRHFTDYAESWRQAFIDQLNEAFSERAGNEGWNYRAGPELWKQAPPLDYRAPSAAFALETHALSLVSLLCWFVLAFALAFMAARRVKVV